MYTYVSCKQSKLVPSHGSILRPRHADMVTVASFVLRNNQWGPDEAHSSSIIQHRLWPAETALTLPMTSVERPGTADRIKIYL
jgi:hypothetical protein